MWNAVDNESIAEECILPVTWLVEMDLEKDFDLHRLYHVANDE